MWFNLLKQFSEEQRMHFYELLVHNLTISVRGIWSDPMLGDSEKVERMKQINELLHRVTAKVMSQRFTPLSWPDDDFGKMIESSMESDKPIEMEIKFALRVSYLAVAGEKNTE